MQKDEELKIYNDAIDFFGITSQKDELADVEITLAQLKMIYGIHQAVEEHKDFKLRRLASNMVKLKAQKEGKI